MQYDNRKASMRKLVEKFNNKICCSVESIKNRYPCKIIKAKCHDNLSKASVITYQAVSRLNLRESSVENLLSDPMIVEKLQSGCVFAHLFWSNYASCNKSNNHGCDTYRIFINKRFFIFHSQNDLNDGVNSKNKNDVSSELVR